MLSTDYIQLFNHVSNGGIAIGLIDYKSGENVFRDACKIKKNEVVIEFGVRGICYEYIDYEFLKEFRYKGVPNQPTEEQVFVGICEENHVEFALVN
jgi:hypothetical protein